MSIFKPDILEGKVAFVTGGGTGICRTITEHFAAHGAKTAIVGRRQEVLDQTAKEISEQSGRECLAVSADVRKPETIEAAIAATKERLGGLDIVVNGAAGNFLCPAAALSYNGFRTVMDIDTNGTFNVSRAAFDAGLGETGGSIINISATLHFAATPMQVHVSAAKAAIDAMSRTLALEWGPMGVRVNVVAPGPIDDTEGMSRLAPGHAKQKVIEAIPLRRFGTRAEVADLCLYLASDASSYVTGANFVIDGGAWFGHSMFQSFFEG